MMVRTFALYAVAACASGQVLWKEPAPFTKSDWHWGPGGEKLAPQPPFQFTKEKMTGTNPKVEVKDANRRQWIVKFGAEVHSDIFVPRLLAVLGYAAEPTYYVPHGWMDGVHGLKRAKYFVSKEGSFSNARFKLRQHHSSDAEESRAWSWTDNPFVGTPQLNGLKILIMLTSNWDTKDVRDGAGSNNEIIRVAGNSSPWFAVTDWGASFGRSGSIFTRDRWDWNGYRVQTANFVRLTPNGTLDWGFKGKHGEDIVKGVTLADVRWLNQYLSKISDDDLLTGFAASGASEHVAREYTRLLRQRIEQLEHIAQAQPVETAAK